MVDHYRTTLRDDVLAFGIVFKGLSGELSRVNHIISSTIKALIVTLPEPSSMDRGPRTGGTGGVLLSALDFIDGGGA